MIEKLQGQEIIVQEFKLTNKNDIAYLFLTILFQDNIYTATFVNVSRLNIQDMSIPFEIGGFEIIHNKELGWEKFSRYTVHDFEDEKIFFYCENFDIV